MFDNRDIEKINEDIKKVVIKELKEYFKDKIKTSFLIARWENIRKNININKYYQFTFTLFQVRGDVDFDFDIANHIVGIHTFNTIY